MLRTRSRVAATGVALVGLAAGITGIVGMLPSARATSVVGTYRFAGTTRYDTARLIGTYKPQGASTFAFGTPVRAVLASGDNFPDALSANFLAGVYGSPIFLTSATVLRQEAVSGLQTLGTRNVTIVGGSAAVSADQDAQLSSDGFVVQRIAGPDRDGTAADVASAGSGSIGNYNGQGLTALVAADDSSHYVDALSGGPLSYAGHFPILLTPSDSLSSETSSALTSLKIKHVIILGGTSAVSANVQSQIEALSITVERLAGANRQQTAIAIASAELTNVGFGGNQYDLAVGDNFPDALAGGPLGGVLKAPILLTADPTDLSSDTSGYLSARNSTVNELFVYGGTAAVSDGVVAQAVGETTCNGGTPGSTSTTSTSSTSTTTPGSTTTSTTMGLPLNPTSSTTSSTSTSSTTSSTSSTTTSLPPCNPPPSTTTSTSTTLLPLP